MVKVCYENMPFKLAILPEKVTTNDMIISPVYYEETLPRCRLRTKYEMDIENILVCSAFSVKESSYSSLAIFVVHSVKTEQEPEY